MTVVTMRRFCGKEKKVKIEKKRNSERKQSTGE
jgi:hypothetical protein